MGPVDVRRLAAIDMWGSGGSILRRRIILAEFVLGATLGVLIGASVAISTDDPVFRLFGAWIALSCLNYVPLAVHAISLMREGALEVELTGVDIKSELARYTKAQLWIAVPLLFVLTAIPQALGNRPARA